MPAIITNDIRIYNADSFQRTVEDQPSYAVIAKTTSWDDDTDPPTPIDSDKAKTALFKNLLALKRIQASNIQSICPRVDWTTGEVYDEYRDDVNMIDDPHPITGNFRRFYVVTDEFNVYKCISNNDRSASTVKPTGSGTSSFETGDGYVWKYMYTLRSVDVLSFLTEDWMPCYTLKANDGSSQWQVQQQAVDGSIEHIRVDSGGSGYDPNNPPVVDISGDGQNAAAEAEVDTNTGEITRIVVTDIGSGYTEATISFSNTQGGSGAAATAVLSPVGGHGYDAKSELGAVHKMIRVELEGDEGGVFPTGEYRQVAILQSPMSTDQGSLIYPETEDAQKFEEGQILTGQDSGATGIVRTIDVDGKFLYLSDVVGQFQQNESIENNEGISITIKDLVSSTNIPLVDLVANDSDIITRKGRFLYHANREPVSRTEDQREDFRFVISF